MQGLFTLVGPVGPDRRDRGSRGGGAFPRTAPRATCAGGRRSHHRRAGIRSPTPVISRWLLLSRTRRGVTRAQEKMAESSERGERERGGRGMRGNKASPFGQPVVLFLASPSPLLFTASPRGRGRLAPTTKPPTKSTGAAVRAPGCRTRLVHHGPHGALSLS